MSQDDFPPNSEASKDPKKKVDRVTSGDAKLRKRSLRKQFTETFIAGDAKTATRYAMFDVLLPGARDVVFEMVMEGFRKLMFGGESSRRGSTTPQSGFGGVVNYNRVGAPSPIMSMLGGGGPQRSMSRAARGKHDFDEVILQDRREAEEVLSQLFEVLSQYGTVTVADLYELVGVNATHADHRWGWQALPGAGVTRVRGGYLLDLPNPQPIA